jgi:hypothetical protein
VSVVCLMDGMNGPYDGMMDVVVRSESCAQFKYLQIQLPIKLSVSKASAPAYY